VKLRRKYEELLKVVARFPGAVAFSGGADSSLLLKAVVDVYGHDARAFFGDSLLQTEADRDNALRTAESLGAALTVVDLTPLDWPEFVANPADRCYICKKKVYLIFTELLPEKGMVLYDGSNLDDLGQYRPGRRAIAELGVKTPLVDAGLNKEDIRRLGESLGVPSWNRDSASCLATRIPAGMAISAENLGRVARYEAVLLAAGYSGTRVRLCRNDPKSIKIEVKESDLPDISGSAARKHIISKFQKTGIENVWLSLQGR
jgi:uncharacterized protein